MDSVRNLGIASNLHVQSFATKNIVRIKLKGYKMSPDLKTKTKYTLREQNTLAISPRLYIWALIAIALIVLTGEPRIF